jgi:hypothetical protein
VNGREFKTIPLLHAMAIDAKGNAYTADVDPRKRIQKIQDDI